MQIQPSQFANAVHHQGRLTSRIVRLFVLIFSYCLYSNAASETWRGLTIAPEHRCAPYDRKSDYRYSQSVEKRIVHQIGAIYGPYTKTCFDSTSQTDIEHIVATSEAHDSGLCAQSRDIRRQFANDMRNLTLASPNVNRHHKSGHDAGEWLPEFNQCWFAGRIVEVRQAYNLTINAREARTLEAVLSRCSNTRMEPLTCRIQVSAPAIHDDNTDRFDVLQKYDDNRNGRITCKEARRHGIAPVPSSHPAYPYMRDGDGDGIVCE